MADSSAPQLAPEDADAFVYYAGHYVTVVAKHLLTEGVAPPSIDVDTPHLVRDLLSEGEAGVPLPLELSARLSPIADATLAWDEISGWSARVYLDDNNCAKRWLGYGLVPAPERVAVFLTAIQVDFDSAGSEERPYYRTAGSPYDDVFERLAPYAPPEDSPRHWQNAYTNARNEHFEVRFLTQLTADSPVERASVPLLTSELTALQTLLEWAEPRLGTDSEAVLFALREQLAARLAGVGTGGRGNLAALARTRLAEIESAQEHRREHGLD